jgi:hypothetical protein
MNDPDGAVLFIRGCLTQEQKIEVRLDHAGTPILISSIMLSGYR